MTNKNIHNSWLKDSTFSDKPDFPAVFAALILSIFAILAALQFSPVSLILAFTVFLITDYSSQKIENHLGNYAGTRLIFLAEFFAWTALTLWALFTVVIIVESLQHPLPIMHIA